MNMDFIANDHTHAKAGVNGGAAAGGALESKIIVLASSVE